MERRKIIQIFSGCRDGCFRNHMGKENKRRTERVMVSAMGNGRDKFLKLWGKLYCKLPNYLENGGVGRIIK